MKKYICKKCNFSCRKKYNFDNHKCITSVVPLDDKLIYTRVISLGYNCSVANSLIDCKFRDASYPFDWNFTSIDKVLECFRTDFNNFFDKEHFVNNNNLAAEFKNKKEIIRYVHDGSFSSLINDNIFYTKQKDKYNRRINRLLNYLNDDKENILFVRLDYNDINNELIDNLINILNEKCKSKYKLLIFTKNNLLKNNEKVDIIKLNNFNRWIMGEYLNKNINALKYNQLKKNYNN